MSDQTRAAHHLTAINTGLLGLFEDYCQRNASPELLELLSAYQAQRLDLVLTVHASISGADFICCALPIGGAPAELVQLFTVQTYPLQAGGKAH